VLVSRPTRGHATGDPVGWSAGHDDQDLVAMCVDDIVCRRAAFFSSFGVIA
jgi:hypothetical protein